MTDRVLDRSHFRWTRPVRVQLVQFPRNTTTSQQKGLRTSVLRSWESTAGKLRVEVGSNCNLWHDFWKTEEALNNSLNKILPTMPNKPDGCRLLPTYPTDSVESSE